MAAAFAKQFIALVVFGCVMCSCSFRGETRVPAARASMTAVEAEREIFGRVNGYRRSRGLAGLGLDRRMSEVAREHSRWMARRGKMSHRGSGGRFSKLQGDAPGLVSMAENVALNFGHANPARVAVDGWIRSAGHQRNMTRRGDRLTGVGVAVAKDGTWYFTQLFGR